MAKTHIDDFASSARESRQGPVGVRRPGRRGRPPRGSAAPPPPDRTLEPTLVLGPGEKPEDSEDQDRKVLELTATMLARLPILIFDIPPPLEKPEEDALTYAWFKVLDHYATKWLKKEGPWTVLAMTAATIYGPRMVDKVQRMRKARAGANQNATQAAHSADPNTSRGGAVGGGENVSSATNRQE